MNTATRGHAARGREDMGVPEDMPKEAEKAGEGNAGNTGEAGHAAATVADGARGPICINCFRVTERRPCVIWATHAFTLRASG
ncbi:hypothetical protein GCM10010207_10000 [Streptomyces atratus]|nr:hypothetical protein GCM10010207_10000 [Streptomyces atratus]